MNSLQDLNNYGSNLISYDDQRNPTVKFSSFNVANISTTQSTGSFLAQYPVDIEDIVRPDAANCYYVINVSSVPGTTVSLNTSLPPGIEIEQTSPGVYVIGYIQSAEAWDVVKEPTITVPITFQGSFIYTSYVFWTENSGNQYITWDVGTFIPVSDMSAEASIAITAQKYKGVSNLILSSEFDIFGAGYDYISFEAALAAQGSFTVSALRTARTSGALSSIASATIQGTQNGRLAGNLSAISSVSASVTEIVSVQNSSINRQYITNWYSYPFNAVPYVNFDYFYGTVSEYKVVISTGSGYLYSEDCEELNPGSTATIITSTKAALEAAIKGLRYYPPSYGYTSNVGYQLRFYADGTLIHTGTVAYFTSGSTDNRVSTGVFSTKTQSNWYPSLEEKLYCNKIEFYMIGAGGGGANNSIGGGGAAGETVHYINQTFNNNVYITYDSGGVGGGWGVGSFGVPNAGGQGTTATYTYYDSANANNQILVLGGYGGGDGSNGTGLYQGSNTPHTAGTGFVGGNGFSPYAGGGGAGASGNGTNAYSSGGSYYGGTGGPGITFDGVVYGRGGGGKSVSFPDPAGSGFSYTLGSGGFGGPTNYGGNKGNGANTVLLVRTYRG